MGKGKQWTPEEDAYLSKMWGYVSIDGLGKHLNRSRNAVICRVRRLGLPPFLESGDYVTMNQLLHALGHGSVHAYHAKSWVEERGFPMKIKMRSSKARVKVVYLDEFWAWAEKNRSFVDFSRMEPLALGQEPAWVQEQRRIDYRSFAIQRKDPWTEQEDSRLKMLLGLKKYGYAELSEMLSRSAGAIQRRISDLGLTDKPVRVPTHGQNSVWTPEHVQILCEGIRNGVSYTILARQIGKSEKAVRGRVYLDYLTENADKVRAMLGDGKWGDGAPLPTVKQGIYHSRYRTDTNTDLERLAGLLLLRLRDLRKEEGKDDYWQKESCQHWNLIAGCTKGETDCDACPHFLRIKPQYCCRCGATFLERTEQTFCSACRTARRNQARRKWAREHDDK